VLADDPISGGYAPTDSLRWIKYWGHFAPYSMMKTSDKGKTLRRPGNRRFLFTEYDFGKKFLQKCLTILYRILIIKVEKFFTEYEKE